MIALDCCAGAGGLSLGLQRAGFDVLGVEIDPTAAAVHRAQVGPCDNADLWEYSPSASYDLVAGGIPCQSHSSAGKRTGTSDARGQLYVPFLRIAQGARAVLIENVRGILSSPSATHGTSIQELVAAVSAAGFANLDYRVLNAADYGVPQTRRRLFLVAFASADHRARFRWPDPTHSKVRDLRGLPRWVTVREALALPPGEYGKGRVAGANSWQGMRRIDVDSPAVTIGRSSRPEWLDRLASCVTATEHRANKASTARLTLEQLAALQSFPDEFEFAGTKTQQHAQVGNAVPPLLGEAVGRSIFAALEVRQ